MFTILFYGGIVVAFLMVWRIFKCAKSNRKFYETSTSLWWRRWYKWRYLFAFLFVPILLLEYPVIVDGELYHVLGFPLVSAAFDSTGRDFISPITGIFLLIDVAIIYFSIHIIICILQRWASERIK